MKRAQGFTIVEVIVVVIVVGILATLGTFSFIRVQQNVRNDERTTDVMVISDALERYYEKHSVYPSCSTMTQAIGTVADLLIIDESALTAPTATTGTNSITCTALTTTGPDAYRYVGDTTTECNAGTFCFEYTLQYRREGDNAIISKGSIQCGKAFSNGCQRPAGI